MEMMNQHSSFGFWTQLMWERRHLSLVFFLSSSDIEKNVKQ
ncbi:hypothetical protein RchiOBHm_Chr6g0281641 [Rosa chinensis]|uniref:Uncharacterized protein n=1 Tax=Rosa chinensis TaxID=74649 RepID=A0A2P6PTK0_ROSCH|nr:hypothetical protein RchiOBHm_Chr6g0281641 [Rosa chinensis]